VHPFRFQQSSPYGLRHRLKLLWRRLRGGGLEKSQRLYFVTLNGNRYKRIVFQDSATAAALEDRLERLGFAPWFPTVVTRYENELWLEFIKGRTADAGSGVLAESLADFYAALYRTAPQQRRLEETRLPLRLGRDLDFLQQAGVLDHALHRRLRDAAQALAPATLWTGFDYVDPVLKNLLPRDGGGLCAVDVESLVDDVPLGTGVAKAMLHWLSPWEDTFWRRLAAGGAPDIRPAFPYVALCLTARWTKTKLLTGKVHAVSAARFQAFCRPGGAQSAPASAVPPAARESATP
jgi:hypothetical protein